MGGYGHHMPTASERYGANLLYRQLREGRRWAGRARRAGRLARRVGPAIRQAIEATRNGRPAVLEMLTAQDTAYPAAGQALRNAETGVLVTA